MKGQRLILLTLHQYIQVSPPLQKSTSPLYCCLLQWLIDSAFAVQAGQYLLSLSVQGHEGLGSSGMVNSMGASRRGDRMAPYIASPASRILQGKSGQWDHRAIVPMADCFSAREVGAASRHRATAVQREPEHPMCLWRRENAFSCCTPKYPTWVSAPSGWVIKDFALRNRHRLFFSHYIMLACLL